MCNNFFIRGKTVSLYHNLNETLTIKNLNIMASIFDKAKKNTAAPTAKKDDKVVVNISGKDFDEKLARFNALKREMANLEAEVATLEGDIKGIGAEKFIELYTSSQRNPGSFKLASESGEKIMIIAMDRYLKIDQEKADALRAAYGDKIVTENTIFSFEPTLLNKFGAQISKLIEKATFMSDEEKDALIVATTKLEVAKGAIDEAMTLGKGDVETFLSDIQPVMQAKQTK